MYTFKEIACFENKDRVDLKPEYIQEMMEDKAKKEDEIKSLKKDLKDVKKKNKEYKSKNSELLLEIEKLKSTCNQYQLMLQFQNNNQNNVNNNNFNNQNNINNTNFNNQNNVNNNNFNNQNNINNTNFNNQNNINNFTPNNFVNCGFNNNSNTCNQNNIMGGNNIVNNNMNNNMNNMNYFKGALRKKGKKNSNIITIIFKFEGYNNKIPVSTYGSSRLMDVFCSILNLNNEYQDITKLNFKYCTRDITKHFLNNDEVDSLNLVNNSIIEVIKIQNVV